MNPRGKHIFHSILHLPVPAIKARDKCLQQEILIKPCPVQKHRDLKFSQIIPLDYLKREFWFQCRSKVHVVVTTCTTQEQYSYNYHNCAWAPSPHHQFLFSTSHAIWDVRETFFLKGGGKSLSPVWFELFCRRNYHFGWPIKIQ